MCYTNNMRKKRSVTQEVESGCTLPAIHLNHTHINIWMPGTLDYPDQAEGSRSTVDHSLSPRTPTAARKAYCATLDWREGDDSTRVDRSRKVYYRNG